MTERRPNHINRDANRRLAHGVRVDGTVYLHGVPRTMDTEKRKKDTLTRKTVLLTPGKSVLLKFGK